VWLPRTGWPRSKATKWTKLTTLSLSFFLRSDVSARRPPFGRRRRSSGDSGEVERQTGGLLSGEGSLEKRRKGFVLYLLREVHCAEGVAEVFLRPRFWQLDSGHAGNRQIDRSPPPPASARGWPGPLGRGLERGTWGWERSACGAGPSMKRALLAWPKAAVGWDWQRSIALLQVGRAEVVPYQ